MRITSSKPSVPGPPTPSSRDPPPMSLHETAQLTAPPWCPTTRDPPPGSPYKISLRLPWPPRLQNPPACHLPASPQRFPHFFPEHRAHAPASSRLPPPPPLPPRRARQMDHYPLEEHAAAAAQVGEAAVAQPADAAVDNDEGPPSRTTMFLAAVWQAFTAAPPGHKPCIACVFLRFANGR